MGWIIAAFCAGVICGVVGLVAWIWLKVLRRGLW